MKTDNRKSRIANRLIALVLAVSLAWGSECEAMGSAGAGFHPRPPWDLNEMAGRHGDLPLQLFSSQALGGRLGFARFIGQFPLWRQFVEWDRLFKAQVAEKITPTYRPAAIDWEQPPRVGPHQKGTLSINEAELIGSILPPLPPGTVVEVTHGRDQLRIVAHSMGTKILSIQIDRLPVASGNKENSFVIQQGGLDKDSIVNSLKDVGLNGAVAKWEGSSTKWLTTRILPWLASSGVEVIKMEPKNLKSKMFIRRGLNFLPEPTRYYSRRLVPADAVPPVTRPGLRELRFLVWETIIQRRNEKPAAAPETVISAYINDQDHPASLSDRVKQGDKIRVLAASEILDFPPQSLNDLPWEESRGLRGIQTAEMTHWRGHALAKPFIMARKFLTLSESRDSFNRHLIAYLLDEYFRKTGNYKTPHIAPPIGHDSHGLYCYEFIAGSNRTYARNFPSRLLPESSQVLRAFQSAGIDFDNDIFLAKPGSSLVTQASASSTFVQKIHNIVIQSDGPSVWPTLHWWRVDFAHSSFGFKGTERFRIFLVQNGQLLRELLGPSMARLLELAFYRLPDAGSLKPRTPENPQEYDRLINEYQRDLAVKLFGPTPESTSPQAPRAAARDLERSHKKGLEGSS